MLATVTIFCLKKVLKFAQTTNNDVSPLILCYIVFIGKTHIVILKLVQKIGFIFATFNSNYSKKQQVIKVNNVAKRFFNKIRITVFFVVSIIIFCY